MKKVTSLFCLLSLLFAGSSGAEEITIRVHHFMSQKASLHAQFLVPLKERLAKASQNRLKLEIYSSMSLGGAPGDLYDQAVDGAVDSVLTLTGYTPGRFPRSEVFELPFIMTDAVATSGAYYDLVSLELQDEEFEEVKILASWVHGPGVIHSEEPIIKLEDLRGQELRGPTQVITDLLGELGATPVGMPLPKISENLSKGVIDGAVIPWEIVPSIKLQELVSNHTELSGPRALYTATFVLALNWDVYDALPTDLRAILDEETGKMLSRRAASVMTKADVFGRQSAEEAGNHFIVLDEDEVARWEEASQPVYGRWFERATDKGFNGSRAVAQAKELIEANKSESSDDTVR